MNLAIKRIPNPDHTRRVLETRRALRLVPPSEGVWACDSGSDRNGGDANAAPGEASQSGPKGIAHNQSGQSL